MVEYSCRHNDSETLVAISKPPCDIKNVVDGGIYMISFFPGGIYELRYCRQPSNLICFRTGKVDNIFENHLQIARLDQGFILDRSFTVFGDDWRQEAEALRLQEIDEPKKVLQRRNITQIHPDTEKRSNCSTGRFFGVAVVGLLVALYGRERKTLSGNYGPWKRITSFLGGLVSSSGKTRTSKQDWKKQKPSIMAAEAAEARHGGNKKKKKKKKKRSH